jgi:hypothetical protein
MATSLDDRKIPVTSMCYAFCYYIGTCSCFALRQVMTPFYSLDPFSPTIFKKA